MNPNEPGCFGIAVVHMKNETCKQCPALTRCRYRAMKTLLELDMDVSDLTKHYTDLGIKPSKGSKTSQREGRKVTGKVVITPDQKRLIDAMPVKPARIATALMGRGIDIKASLLCGENPFSKNTPAFLRVPCAMLIDGGFTKAELKEALLDQFPAWNERTAEGQLSVAFALLCGLDCVEGRAGRYQIKQEN